MLGLHKNFTGLEEKHSTMLSEYKFEINIFFIVILNFLKSRIKNIEICEYKIIRIYFVKDSSGLIYETYITYANQ